jgi:hypothetical protein
MECCVHPSLASGILLELYCTIIIIINEDSTVYHVLVGWRLGNAGEGEEEGEL